MTLNDRAFQLFQELFELAEPLGEPERTELLKKQCGADQDLFSALIKLFETHEKAEEVHNLEEPLAWFASETEPVPIENEHNLDLEGKNTSDCDLQNAFSTKYILGEEIGRGGMGVIFQGRDKALRRDVAIKFMRKNSKKHPELALRFREEAQLQGQLEHPNICPVHELGFDEAGNPFFTMKKVRGHSLREIIYALKDKQEPFKSTYTLSSLLNIFLKICDAVNFAHSNGVIHRDLKPGNIMIGEYGEVWVMDWGLAKIIDQPEKPGHSIASDRSESGSHETVLGKIMGTLYYMPPEQAMGEVDSLSKKTDIYSLGAILYELLVLKAPYEDTPDSRLLGAVALNLLESPRTILRTGTVSEELEAVVLKAMEAEPEARYSSIDALKKDIQNFLDGGMLSAMHYSAFKRAKKWIKKHRQATITFLVSFLLILASGFVSWRWQVHKTQAEQERYLAKHQITLDELTNQLQKAKQLFDKNSYEDCINQIQLIQERFGDSISQMTLLERLKQCRPYWIEQLNQIPGTLHSLKEQALNAWIVDELDRFKNDPAYLETLEATFEKMKILGAGISLPLSNIGLTLTEHYASKGLWEKVAIWTAASFTHEPDSLASASCFLINAQHSFDERDFTTSTRQFFMAKQIIGTQSVSLLCKATLGLVKSLLNLGPETLSPISNGSLARETALQILLTILEPTGNIRPEFKPFLSEEEKQAFQKEAQAYLFILRHITKRVKVEGLVSEGIQFLGSHDTNGDGKPESIQIWHPALPRFGVNFVSPKPGENDGSLFSLAYSKDFSPWFDKLFPEYRSQKYIIQEVMFGNVLKSEKTPQIFFQVALPKGTLTLALPNLDSEIPFFRMLVPNTALGSRHYMDFVDFDKNGLRDFVITFRSYERQAYLVLQEKPGVFSDPRPFDPRTSFDERSDYHEVYIKDLDHDGIQEIILSHGAWNDYSVEIWRIDEAASPKKITSFFLGEPRRLVFFEEDNQTLIASSPSICMPGMRRSILKQRHPIQEQSIPILWFQKDHLETVRVIPSNIPEGYQVRAPYKCISLLNSPTTIPYLIEAKSLFNYLSGEEYETTEWIQLSEYPIKEKIFNESVTDFCTLAGRQYSFSSNWKGPGPQAKFCYNTLETLDLKNLPHFQFEAFSEIKSEENYQKARFLFDFGLYIPSIAYTQELLVKTQITDPTFLKLWDLKLEGLLQTGQSNSLLENLEQMPILPELATQVVFLCKELISKTGHYERILNLLGKWLTNQALLPSAQKEIVDLQQNLLHDKSILGKQQFDICQVLNSSGTKPNFFSTLPTMLVPKGNTLFLHGKRREWVIASEQGNFTALPFSGLFVKTGLGPYRFDIEMELNHVNWSSKTHLGLFSLESFFHNNPYEQSSHYVDIGANGGNFLNQTNFMLQWDTKAPAIIDSLIGQTILIQGYRNSRGVCGVILREKSSGNVVFQAEKASINNSKNNLFLFGVRNYDADNYLEATIFKFSISGDVETVRNDNPQLLSFFNKLPFFKQTSHIVRQTLQGEKADSDWGLFQSSPDKNPAFQQQMDILRLQQTVYNPNSFLTLVNTLKIEGRESAISDYLQSIPSYRNATEKWDITGLVLREVYFPKQTWKDVIDKLSQTPLPKYALPFITKALLKEYPDDEHLRFVHAQSLFHETDLTFDAEFLATTEESCYISKHQAWIDERMAFVYYRSMQWEKALKILNKGCKEHEYKLKETVEEISKLRKGYLRSQIEKYKALGF